AVGLLSLPNSKSNFFRSQPNLTSPIFTSGVEQGVGASTSEKSLGLQGLFFTVTSHYLCAWSRFSGS
ncbi:hypothetical protein PANDA_015193, partial [Ailuropoda melanoleuca]